MDAYLINSETQPEERAQWAEACVAFYRRIWGACYESEYLGITREMVDEEFNDSRLTNHLRAQFLGNTTAWILADDHGVIRGTISVHPTHEGWKMQGLYLDPHESVRGQGHGKYLFSLAEQLTGGSFSFEVPWYFEAVNFYERMGAQKTGDVVHYPWNSLRMREVVYGAVMRLGA